MSIIEMAPLCSVATACGESIMGKVSAVKHVYGVCETSSAIQICRGNCSQSLRSTTAGTGCSVDVTVIGG